MDNTSNELINRELRIIVYGKVGVGKTTLCNIIKNCLERDYSFRTLFANAKISIDEALDKTENNIKKDK